MKNDINKNLKATNNNYKTYLHVVRSNDIIHAPIILKIVCLHNAITPMQHNALTMAAK